MVRKFIRYSQLLCYFECVRQFPEAGFVALRREMFFRAPMVSPGELGGSYVIERMELNPLPKPEQSVARCACFLFEISNI